MQLPSGYRLEPVLTEPHIAEPVMVAFDGNGRMYVAEMRTYMQDADGTGEQEPFSRVSRHEDTDGDGVYDRHTVFADKLLLPRILLPLDDRIIIGETNTDDLYIYRDSDGDGVADEKTLWFKGGPRGGNMEHQPNGLVWAMDNGIYSTYYDYRLRFGADGKAIKETIPVNGGQWGLTQDDWGKVWFVNAGNETGPVHFQQHIIYGQFSAPDEHIGQYKVVWPIAQHARHPGRSRPAAPGQHAQPFHRHQRPGHLPRRPPAGRVARQPVVCRARRPPDPPHADHGRGWRHAPRQRLRKSTGRIHPRDRSAVPPRQHDHRARRHSLYRRHVSRHHPAGRMDPEGLAICANRSRPTICRSEIGRGRIYRLRHEGFEPGPQPRMLDETPAQWVQHLSHPNGWWRDTAQKLLVLRRDLSVVPALEKLASQRRRGFPPAPACAVDARRSRRAR